MSRSKKDRKIPRIGARSGVAVAAMHKTGGGPMKHRLEPKAGAKNDQPELLNELVSNSIEHCGGVDCGIHDALSMKDAYSMKFCVCECGICSDIDDGITKLDLDWKDCACGKRPYDFCSECSRCIDCHCECSIDTDIDDGTTDFIDKQLKKDG
jgi:hypothetical protein